MKGVVKYLKANKQSHLHFSGNQMKKKLANIFLKEFARRTGNISAGLQLKEKKHSPCSGMIASMRTWFQLQCMQAVEEEYSVHCQILKIGNVLNKLGKEPQLVAWNIDNDVVFCHLRKIWGSGWASVKCIGVLWCSHRLGRETDSNWDQNVGFAISSMDVPCMIVYFLSSYEINRASYYLAIVFITTLG